MKKILYLLIAALLLGIGTASAAPQKKKTRAKAPVARTAVAPANFSGTFTNSYSDGIGGVCTHLLTVAFDEAAGTCTGMHTNESGVERAFHGTLQGGKLVCIYDEDGDEFATMSLIDANTIKLEGFTGTFKRGTAADVTPAYSGDSGAAYVDPAFEQIRKK
ncbi:MAG: hypothetical protein IJT30_07170 [Muribaculaceae bacterium]|nr:hypothetical protein [Muribaculaceae bacterium]